MVEDTAVPRKRRRLWMWQIALLTFLVLALLVPTGIYYRLAGLPDIPESRPHSKISEAKGWKAPAFLRQN